MIAILAFPAYILFHTFVLKLVVKWLKCCHPLFEKNIAKALVVIIYYILCLSIYIAPLFPPGKIEKFFRVIGYYCFGINIFIIAVLLIVFVGRYIILHSSLKNMPWISKKGTVAIVGTISILAIAITCIIGHLNATKIRTTNYDVKIEKNSSLKELNIVLVADQHLGYNIGTDLMEQMVEKINACNPDVVLVGGDIFDNCYEYIEEPLKITQILKKIKSKYGVYAVLGNHDCEEPIVGGFTFKSKVKHVASDGMYEFLRKSNIEILCDEYTLIGDSIYIFGRPDKERPGKYVKDNRLSPTEIIKTMDSKKPIIILEHEPKNLVEIADTGVDLHMAGHTHNGQIFPLNIGTAFMFENSYGLKKINNMTSIVTSGVGVYGPYIRIGTIPEICNIHVSFLD